MGQEQSYFVMQVYRMKCCCHLDSSANVQPSLFGGDGRAEFTEEREGRSHVTGVLKANSSHDEMRRNQTVRL